MRFELGVLGEEITNLEFRITNFELRITINKE